MAKKPKVSYKRAPSEKLLKLLMPDGHLAPLITLNNRIVCGSELDVHLRVDDEVHVYCGRTAILKVKMLKSPRGYVSCSASDTYKKQQCSSRLFKRWEIGDPAFCEGIDTYLNNVKVNTSFIKGEGAVQTLWSAETKKWIPFDREAQFGDEAAEHQEEGEVDAAFCRIQTRARQCNWKDPDRSAEKLDRLAVDDKERLVLLELKDGSKNDDKVYYVPFQLLQYIWEWHNAHKDVQEHLQALIIARKKVGLTPKHAPELTAGIRAAVGFGYDIPTAETKKRYKEVLKIVNRYLPCGVDPIETWAWSDEGPYCLNW